jgi:hypothetical protein
MRSFFKSTKKLKREEQGVKEGQKSYSVFFIIPND